MKCVVGLALAAVVLGSALTAEAATVGPLTVTLEVEVGEPQRASPRITTWSVEGFARYTGLLEGRDSTISLYGEAQPGLPSWEFVSVWPTKIDIGGLEEDVGFVCGIVTAALGGPCFAGGALVGIGTARVLEHDLRAGGRLVWEIAFLRAACPRCPAG